MAKTPRAALVTGAGRRLGRAMALHLAQNGYALGIHYNDSQADAEELVKRIRDDGGKAVSVKARLQSAEDVASLVERTISGLGMPLTLLVNSASAFEDDDIDTMTVDSWALHMDVNLRAPAMLAQAFARQIGPDHDGLIVNLIDQRVLKLTPQFLTYTLSKSALHALTYTLAQALGPRGIRVNGIGPGPTLKNKRQSEEDWRRQNEATILGHGADPADICRALQFLIDSKAVTGQMIAVDGGQHLVWQTPDVMVGE